MHPLAALVRRYVDDWLNAADATVCEEILDPGYSVHISGVVLEGRDEAYVPATLRQLQQFPGLTVRVHELVVGQDQAAMRFTEHGSSSGRPAAWAGVALFSWDGRRLTEAFVEEDYASRREQLKGSPSPPVAEGAADVWQEQPADADPEAEEVVRRWLRAPDAVAHDAIVCDHGRAEAAPPLREVQGAQVHALFSAGTRVAFHAAQRGRPPAGDGTATLHSAGIVEVAGSGIVAGHVVRDRLGLQRSLRG